MEYLKEFDEFNVFDDWDYDEEEYSKINIDNHIIRYAIEYDNHDQLINLAKILKGKGYQFYNYMNIINRIGNWKYIFFDKNVWVRSRDEKLTDKQYIHYNDLNI